MTIDISSCPFPVTYRELWLPRAINGNATLPSSRYNGHPLTLTGARKGTTANGVHFNGAVDSNINCGAIHNATAKLWLSFRFKLDQPYAAGSGVQYLWGKVSDGTNFITLGFDTADGKLYLLKFAGGLEAFNISAQDGGADIVSWEAGRWYHVLASISDTAGIGRLRIDNGTIVLTNDVSAAPNGGDFVIGDYDDPGGGNGFEGVIADFFVGTGDLTVAQEADLSKGIPPANAVNEWLLDEGRGVTAYDQGTGGNNGTLDTSCTWDFGQVQQPVLSLDSINDLAQSTAGVDILGDVTVVWVGKMKSTYNALSGSHAFCQFWIDVGNYLFFYYDSASDEIKWQVRGSTGAIEHVAYTPKPMIDAYLIFIGTLTLQGVMKPFVNGSLVGVNTGVGVVVGVATTFYIGANHTPAIYDVSKPLLVGLIDGAFTDKQALAYSRWLDRILNLGLGI